MKTLSLCWMVAGAAFTLAAQNATAGPMDPVSPSGPATYTPSSLWDVVVGAHAQEFEADYFAEGHGIGSQDEVGYGGSITFRRALNDTGLSVEFGYSLTYAENASGEITLYEYYEDNGDEIYELAIHELELWHHRFHVGIDYEFELCRGASFAVGAGPFVGITSVDFDGRVEEYVEPGHFLEGKYNRESSTEFSAGAYVGAALRVNIPNTSAFLQVSGGYSWMTDVSVGGSNAAADIGGGSWNAGIGIGFSF